MRAGLKEVPLRYWLPSAKEVKTGKKKAGDVRCGECLKMNLETECCCPPVALPLPWDADLDPKLKRIRRALEETEREGKRR
tara:strand:- start:103 stop:345 length:243 start_codon:yes stop_codon:yes gene_type:complete